METFGFQDNSEIFKLIPPKRCNHEGTATSENIKTFLGLESGEESKILLFLPKIKFEYIEGFDVLKIDTPIITLPEGFKKLGIGFDLKKEDTNDIYKLFQEIKNPFFLIMNKFESEIYRSTKPSLLDEHINTFGKNLISAIFYSDNVLPN